MSLAIHILSRSYPQQRYLEGVVALGLSGRRSSSHCMKKALSDHSITFYLLLGTVQILEYLLCMLSVTALFIKILPTTKVIIGVSTEYSSTSCGVSNSTSNIVTV
jgi:hypothetical protein